MDKIKILWIADMNLSHYTGGAQRTDDVLINYGLSHNIDITRFNHDNTDIKVTKKTQKEYDYIITGNVYIFSKIPGFLDWVHQLTNHIRFEHDSNYYLNQKQRKQLYENNKLSIFLSKEHHQFFIDTYGSLFNQISIEIINSAIDTNKFKNLHQQRENATVWAGLLHPLKGLNTLKQRAQSGESIIIAALGNQVLIKDIISLPNITYLGCVDYENMSNLFNQYKTLLYYPGQLEPFCRTVAEAILCGMEIDTANSPHKIGALELYKNVGYSQFQSLCKTAPQRFWDTISNV